MTSQGHLLYPVSWLPVKIQNDSTGKPYAFDLKSLLDHYHAVNSETLLQSKGWQETLNRLREMKQLCAENGIRLIIVFAPDKPHVLPPLIKDTLSPDQLRAFMALKEKHLPPAKELVDTLFSRLDVQESTMKQFCEKESIEFISLTDTLRQNITSGTQVYFTYDQHWAPPGHQIVAQILSDYLTNSQDNVGWGLPRQ